jgi:hypothetical protein
LFKLKLGLTIGFLILILPDMIGTYSYLTYYDIHPIVAAPATVGVEFGGALFELLNTFRQLQGAHITEVLVLLIGSIWAIHRIIYGVAAFKKFNKMFGSQDNPQIFVLLIGAGFFALSVALAVAVDMYILPANAQRVPGVVYTLNNLDSTIFPLADATRDHLIQETVNQSGNASKSINKSITNSTTG